MENQIDEAVNILNRGGIVIFPTDTTFGIGCRIDNENAIKKLFEVRKRPLDQAVPVLVSDFQMAKEYFQEVPEEVVQNLVNPYWPGALTIVLKAKTEKIPSLVRGGKDTVGLRMPNHQTILEIIKRAGVPVLGPSANFHSENTPYEFKDLDLRLTSLVDYVVEGSCSVKSASTVIDCTQSPWKILRQGAINVNI